MTILLGICRFLIYLITASFSGRMAVFRPTGISNGTLKLSLAQAPRSRPLVTLATEWTERIVRRIKAIAPAGRTANPAVGRFGSRHGRHERTASPEHRASIRTGCRCCRDAAGVSSPRRISRTETSNRLPLISGIRSRSGSMRAAAGKCGPAAGLLKLPERPLFAVFLNHAACSTTSGWIAPMA